MTNATASSLIQAGEYSLAKQVLLSLYAKGQITRHQLAEAIEATKPPVPKLTWRYKVAAAILASLVMALIPPGAKRQD